MEESAAELANLPILKAKIKELERPQYATTIEDLRRKKAFLEEYGGDVDKFKAKFPTITMDEIKGFRGFLGCQIVQQLPWIAGSSNPSGMLPILPYFQAHTQRRRGGGANSYLKYLICKFIFSSQGRFPLRTELLIFPDI
jgi:hypothetical protein